MIVNTEAVTGTLLYGATLTLGALLIPEYWGDSSDPGGYILLGVGLGWLAQVLYRSVSNSVEDL